MPTPILKTGLPEQRLQQEKLTYLFPSFFIFPKKLEATSYVHPHGTHMGDGILHLPTVQFNATPTNQMLQNKHRSKSTSETGLIIILEDCTWLYRCGNNHVHIVVILSKIMIIIYFNRKKKTKYFRSQNTDFSNNGTSQASPLMCLSLTLTYTHTK